MSESAADWLRRNALEHLADAFNRQKISVDLFGELTESDLADLGLTIGERKLFLRALRGDENQDTAGPQGLGFQTSTGRITERRVLTIAFVDLVGSTAMSTQIDVEELHEMLRSYLSIVKEITNSFGGHVLKYLGDGVLSVFGWPIAHENQGERAVLTSLEVLRTVQAMTPRPDLSLKLRAGIASGSLVVGDIAGDVNDVTGPAANMAQRLQSHAEPGEILIDSTTRATLPNGFQLSALGPVELKGFSEPVEAFRVEAADGFLQRHTPTSPFGLPLVGRENELKTLDDLWSTVLNGRGQSVIIQGEAGIGKTRLVSEFLRRQTRVPEIAITLQCFEYRSVSAMFPLQQALMRAASFSRDDDTASRRSKLSGFLEKWCAQSELALPLFADLLSIADQSDQAFLETNVPDRTRLALELFVEMTLRVSQQGPVVVLLEDAHWADPSTATYCRLLSERIADQDVLLIISARPEWRPPDDAFHDADLIRVEKLMRRESRRMVERAVGTKLSPTTFEAILQRGQDNPLYLEELARVAADSKQGDELPLSIRSSFLARIDRLGTDRPIIQLLAVLGTTFSLESLLEITDYDRSTLMAAVSRLVDAGMLVQNQDSGPDHYQFRHALIQETAYASVLRSTRGKLHNQVAEALLKRLEENRYADPEVLARHLSLATRSAEAIPFWQAAGDRLAGQSAHTEAAQQYEKGLADVDRLPVGSLRDQHEYELRVRLSAALLTVEGWSADRVAQNYEAALVLSNRLGDPRKQFVAMRGRFNVLLLSGNLSAARALVEELSQIAERTGDKMFAAEALKIDGGCAVHESDFPHAARCLEESINIFTRSSTSARANVFGTDLVVISHAHLAWTRWFLGDTTAAEQHIADALRVARSGQHAFSEAYAEGFASCLHQFRADAASALVHADKVIALSEKYHFQYFEGWGRILRGWSLAFLGTFESGLQEIDRGISIYKRTGAELILPYAIALREEAVAIASAGGSLAVPDGDQVEALETTSESRFYRQPRTYASDASGGPTASGKQRT